MIENINVEVVAQGTKKWIFLDEFNTTNELGIMKEMMVDRTYLGEKFKDQNNEDNYRFIAACNQWRLKTNE